MTTIYPTQVTCAQCGTETEFMEVGSTSIFGSPDLDLRPAPLARHNLSYQVQQCPNCGYCAVDVSTPLESEAAKKLLSSDGYQSQLYHADFPELANQFVCLALLLEAEGNLNATAWAYLSAAWACDDEGNDVLARHCRVRAAEYFQQSPVDEDQDDLDDDDPEEKGSQEALLTDVLRRAGQLDLAQAVCEQGLRVATSDVLQAVLRYEQSLISRQDTDCHTIEEAMAGVE
jgi:uncharacterized protein (DUF2225 family)